MLERMVITRPRTRGQRRGSARACRDEQGDLELARASGLPLASRAKRASRSRGGRVAEAARDIHGRQRSAAEGESGAAQHGVREHGSIWWRYEWKLAAANTPHDAAGATSRPP
jgi:hypothetical protein